MQSGWILLRCGCLKYEQVDGKMERSGSVCGVCVCVGGRAGEGDD